MYSEQDKKHQVGKDEGHQPISRDTDKKIGDIEKLMKDVKWDKREVLSASEMKSVFKVHSRHTDAPYCVKIYIHNEKPKEEDLQRYLHLKHPFIVNIKDFYHWEEKNKHYLATKEDLCDYSLEDLIEKNLKANTTLGPEKMMNLMENVIDAMIYFKTQKISHQSIKPSNILAVNDGEYWKVADVGMEVINIQTVKEVGKKEDHQCRYMWSPELFKKVMAGGASMGETELDLEKSDVFSLGLTVLREDSNKKIRDMQNLNYQSDQSKNALKQAIRGMKHTAIQNLTMKALLPDPKARISWGMWKQAICKRQQHKKGYDDKNLENIQLQENARQITSENHECHDNEFDMTEIEKAIQDFFKKE